MIAPWPVFASVYASDAPAATVVAARRTSAENALRGSCPGGQNETGCGAGAGAVVRTQLKRLRPATCTRSAYAAPCAAGTLIVNEPRRSVRAATSRTGRPASFTFTNDTRATRRLDLMR